ncbi:MAG TPA: hypothetical protein VJ850_05245 [Candidatus Limnocylindrales bacterium]|nr:hypothetical protein [Candidatus Limnocylindrales bacterium]
MSDLDGAPLLHFSEDPFIERFVPHVPATNPDQAPGVWAIDAEHAPVYWFPRNCPRGAVWATTPEQQLILGDRFQTSASRIQATELDRLDEIRAARLFVYELDPAPFIRWPDADGQWIAREPVVPLGVRPVGDLLALHAEAGIELRFVPNLLVFWKSVITSGLPFSGIRLRYAKAAAEQPSAS